MNRSSKGLLFEVEPPTGSELGIKEFPPNETFRSPLFIILVRCTRGWSASGTLTRFLEDWLEVELKVEFRLDLEFGIDLEEDIKVSLGLIFGGGMWEPSFFGTRSGRVYSNRR